ncbi:hypothetical protein ACOSQ3_013554 [Xanthoceras sorbifolium]
MDISQGSISSKALFEGYQQETKLKACRSMDISKGSSSSELEAFNECHQETKLSCRSSMAKSQGRASEALDDDQQEISESEEESKSLTESNLDGSSQVYREGSFEKTLNEIDLNRYADLYHAALKGDWEIAKRIIDKDPEALTAKISMVSMTVLHVAGYSCNSKFVEKLVEKMTPEQVAVVDVNGNTALHYAAFTGVVNVAKALLRKNPNLTEVQGSQGFIPLLSAVVHGAAKGKEMASFLATQTKNPFLEATSTHLLLELTHAGFHDITLDLLRIFPKMAMVDIYGDNMVSILAVRPMDFLSGTRFNFWETWIYQLAPFKPLICTKGDMEDPPENSEDLKDPNSTAWAARVVKWFKRQIWNIVTTLAPGTSQKFQDVKWRHKYALELVTFICERAKLMPNSEILDFFVNSNILNLAGSSGIAEIIKVCLQHFPDLIWIWNGWKTVLDDAVEHRRELVFNLIYARSELCTIYGALDENDSSAKLYYSSNSKAKPCRMHLAAKLAPLPQLSSVSGAALQMQRELQWFKEVENLAHPSDKEKKDCDGHTPRELFTKEHKELVEKAEKWMKDTSTSCMVVTTLVATVVFAAAFTVPGGNNSQGIPIFLQHKPFTVFMISDALALFSALTSVLMFLSILTARYAEEDFLKKLPIKLLIGLGSLFFAIVTMMIAFVAALWIVLHDEFKWVSIPVTVLASIPITVFLSLQLPLFIKIYTSTFIGIFHPQKIW